MTSSLRSEALADGIRPNGIRWFKLSGDLAELSHVSAYPCTWLKSSSKWSASGDADDLRLVYSTISGVTGKQDDFVPCWFNAIGKKWEVVAPPAAGTFIGKTDAQIVKGNSGTVSRYSGTDRTDTGTNDSCYNLFATVSASKWVAYTKIGGVYYLIAAEC